MEYNSEQLNYFRICYIAFNSVPKGLRNVFKREWDFLYDKTTVGGEWKEDPQNGRDFYNNEKKTKKQKNNACYLATIQNGNTAEWDCSCLFFAILFSDSIGTTLSPAVKKDVNDLRQVRNAIAHKNEAELTDADFQNYVARVLAAFNSLKLPVNDIEAVKNQTSFPTAEVNDLKMQAHKLKADLQTKEEEVKTLTFDLQETQNTLQTKQEEVETLTEEINSKVESFCTLTFKPSHQIVRRSNDVTRIMKKLEELRNGSNGAVSTIYLSGNPGCGKSQIARQLGQEIFDKRSRESEGLTFVATLNAETLDSLADSYTSLARHLGITEYALTNLATSKVDSPREKIQHLKRLILPKIKQFFAWLMIADNVVDLTLVRNDLPPTASEEWGHGQVLITTQDSSTIPTNAPHTYHESLSKGMQSDDAVELLRQVSQISNHDHAEKVAEILEYQPLALAAAAFYVQTVVINGSPNYSWKNYLETFSRGEREATEEPLAKQNIAYSKTMTIAIKMALTRALESDEVLKQAFFLFSLCASDSLPIEAAVDFVKFRTRGQTEELIRSNILKSSLITCSYGEDGVPTYLRVHNIVHEVLKSRVFTSDFELRNKVQCISVVIKIFHSLMRRDKERFSASEHVCEKLSTITTHCIVLHEVLTSNYAVKELAANELLPIITPCDLVSWLSLTADVCCSLSKPSDANLFSTSACNFVNYLSDTRDDKLLKAETFSVHGAVLNMQCEYESSLLFLEQARDICIDIHDEQSDTVALIYNRLGNVYSDLDQYSQAKEQYEKALCIRKKIYGEQHGDVANCYSNLGLVYSDLEQHSQAKQHLEKALIIQKKIYGEHHGDVASSYSNLALVYSDLGQHSQAKEYLEKALFIERKIYGELHGAVAASYGNLGSVYSDLGEHSQAKENHEKALSIEIKIYGEHHVEVAGSYSNLGNVYSDLEEHSEAKKYHEKALIIERKIYGEHHGAVAASYSNLGRDYSHLGQHSQAKEYFEKALFIEKNIYGKYHGEVAASYSNLGLVYNDLGQHSQAKEYLKKALVIEKKIYGEHHGNVAVIYRNLGTVCSDLAQYSQAKDHLEKALNIFKMVYGEQHDEVERTNFNLRIVEEKQREHNQARNKCCIIV